MEIDMGKDSLRDCFGQRASLCDEKKAVSFFRGQRVETELSYGELERDANRVANILLSQGVKKGDRVIFYMEKCLFFVVAHLAVQKVGAVGVPLNPGFKKSEMEYLLNDAEAALALVGTDQEAVIREIDPELKILVMDAGAPYQDLGLVEGVSGDIPPIEIGPQDPGLIVYTSGTTGKPKGAVLTQGNLVHDARNIIRIWEITEGDVLCHALPLFHVHGLCFALHTALMAGSHVLLLDQFAPDRVIAMLANRQGEYDCTEFMAVPSMYGKMMAFMGNRTMDFGNMRLWTSGSAPLLAKDFKSIQRIFGKAPVEREGMSETGMNFSNPLHGPRKPGSIGLPLPGLEVRIVDPETHQDVAPGETGEFWLRGPGITPGYWRKPDETTQAFVQGWFRTGDLGRVDEEGYYFLTDRIKHIIISGGENVSPKEVESVINRFDGVVESSVVGISDEKWGERVVAAVVTRPGQSIAAEAIQDFCREHLHNWKCPKEVVFAEELPKNTMGKVLKEEVKRLFESGR